MINSNMSIKYDFGNPEELVKFVIGKSVLESMAEEKRKNIIERVYDVMNNYKSKLLVCDILSDSAKQGELERYLEDLEIHQCLKKLKIYRQRPILYSSPLIRLIVYEM